MAEDLQLIYHMLPRSLWDAQPRDQRYQAATLASEGFIHCTGQSSLLTTVANRFYRDQVGEFVILLIDAGTGRAVWGAMATGEVEGRRSQDEARARLNYAVSQMMARLPTS